MKLYNQDIKFMDFECYDENLSDLESDFKKIKYVNDLERFVEDIVSITKLEVQHIWVYEGSIEVTLAYNNFLKIKVVYLFKSDVLGFILNQQE